MLELKAQRTEFDILISDVLRCHYDFDDFYTYLDKCGCTWYLCKHDKDTFPDGELKRAHIHLVMIFKKMKRCKQILSALCDCLYTNVENIQIMDVESTLGAIQYLIHKNHKEKHQYDLSEVETNDTKDHLKLLMEEDIKPVVLSTKTLEHYIFDDRLSRMSLIQTIGIGSYQHYRPTINDMYEHRRTHKRH